MTRMNRRQFLTLSGVSVLALAGVPGVRRAHAAGRPDRVLVLVELNGGNDGLNTVVPYRDPAYRRLRPTLAIPPGKTIQLDERLGLNSAMEPLLPLWHQHRLAIALGIGYPEPNLSHFRSIDIWETGSASDEYLSDGWIAQLFNKTPLRRDYDADGVILGRNDAGPLFGGGLGTVALGRAERALARAARMRGIATETVNPALAHVLSVRDRLRHSARAILEKRIDAVDLGVSFPRNDFGRQMETAARLLAAGVETPVIKVSIGSFDTHANQAGMHDRLLESLAGGVAAFARAAEKNGFWERVLVMTYSEFGRRPAENGSRGTDHGTAAPHFLVGGRVRGGFYGEQPPLNRLEDGNLGHRLHFRSLYATAARDWWGLPASFFAEPPLGCIG